MIVSTIAGAGGFKANVSGVGDGHIARARCFSFEGCERVIVSAAASLGKEQIPRIGDGDILVGRGFGKQRALIGGSHIGDVCGR